MTLLILPCLLFLRFVGGTWLVTNHHYPSYLRHVLLLTLIFGIWLLNKWIVKGPLYLSGVEVFLLPFLIVVLLSTIKSDNPGLSAEKAAGLGTYFLTGLVLLDLRKKDILWRGLIDAVLLVAVINALLSFYFVFYWFRVFQLSITDVFSNPFYAFKVLPRMPDIANLHTTMTAGYFLMLFPLFVYRFSCANKRVIKLYLFLGFVMTGVIFFLTKSRGGMLGLITSIITFGVVYREKVLPKIQQKFLWRLSVVIGGTTFLGAIYVIVRSRGFSILERSVQCRLEAWKTAVKILQKNPVLGSGLETFGANFLQYRDPSACGKILHVAHNDLLQLGSQFGFLGIFTLMYFGHKYVKKVAFNENRSRKLVKTGLISLAGMAGMGIVTTMIYSPNIIFLLIFYLVGLLPEQAIQPVTDKKINLYWITPLAISVFILSLWTLWRLHPYYLARLSADRELWTASSDKLHEAINRDEKLPYYKYSLGFVEGQKVCDGDTSGEGAIFHLNESMQAYQGWSLGYANRSILYARAGDYIKAVNDMKLASKNDPQNALYHCILGDHYLKLKEHSKAMDELALCVSYHPSWITSTFWEELDVDGEYVRHIYDLSEELLLKMEDGNTDIRLANLYFYLGNFSKSKAVIDQYLMIKPHIPGALLVKSKLLLQEGDTDGAIESISMALANHPRYIPGWEMKGLIFLSRGETKKAERALKISHQLGGSPRTFQLLAEIHRVKGERELSTFLENRAEAHKGRLSYFSHWVASRWHLEKEKLECFPTIDSRNAMITLSQIKE